MHNKIFISDNAYKIMGLLEFLFPDNLSLQPKPYEGAPEKCDKCDSKDIFVSFGLEDGNIRTETYVCNNCGYQGGHSIS